MAISSPIEPWFAVQVIPRHEQKVALRLQNKGHEHFLPVNTCFHQWSDRRKQITDPLFPGYVFCRVSRSAFESVLKTSGVCRIVCFGGRPYPVSEEEIRALQLATSSGLPYCPVPYISTGERVRVAHGPLSGITGIVTRIKNKDRLVISIDVIMKSVSLEVPCGQVVLATAEPLSFRN